MKKVIIIIIGLVLLCCCCSAIALGLLVASPSSYFEFNGQCVRKGVDAHPTSGPCVSVVPGSMMNLTPTPAPNPTPTPPPSSDLIQYNGKNSSEFTFAYPKSFFLDDSSASVTYLYKKDPKLNAQGDFNDNLNISSADTALNVTQANCDYYANQIVSSVGDSLNIDQTSVATDIQTINGLKVCVVSWDAQIAGIDFTQQQYVFSDSVLDKNFIVTVSTQTGSSNVGTFANIVDSFETK